MADIRYRVRTDDYLSHAVVYKDKRKNVSITKDKYTNTKSIIGRSTGREFKPRKSVYKDPNYDPVKRHERYLQESGGGSGRGSGGSGRGSGGSGRSSGGSGRGGGKSSASSKNAISKLVEESDLNTEAQREAARRKIEDLQNQLKEKIEELRKNAYDDSQTEKNSAERRGIVQNLQAEIKALQGKTSEEVKRISKDLSDWITQEKESLARRIAVLQGTKYDANAKKVKEQQQKKRDKEVNSRADAIYKSKTKSKK